MKNIVVAALLVSTFSAFAQDDILESMPVEEVPTDSFEASDTPAMVSEPTSPAESELETKENTVAVEAEKPEAQPVVQSTASNIDDEEKPFNHRKSHWVSTFGFEHTKREVPFQFSGTKRNFKEEQREMLGGRVSFGYEAYMGGGFLLGGGVSGYYMGTAFQNIKEATDPTGERFTEEKDRGQQLGGELYGHAGWMFDFKTKNPFLGDMTYMAMELFAEASAGRGESYFRKDYEYTTTVNESYDAIFTDTFTSASVSGGINFLSQTTGFFLNLKVTTMILDIDKQRTTKAQATGGTTTNALGSVENPDTDPITIYTLGGGYKF